MEFAYFKAIFVILIKFTTHKLIFEFILWYNMKMNFKNFVSILLLFFIFSGCQTIKEKSDSIAEKENKEYGKLVGKSINDLKIELGNPTEDYIDEIGNKVFLYKSKKFGIPCERKFEINQNNVVEGFTSSGCI